jgi:hypothetical protein
MGRLLKQFVGCFLFCSRADFEAIGGFSERYFAAEDVAFVKALRRRGRVVIPRAKVLTSNRKVRTISFWRACSVLFRFVIRGPESYQSREGLGLWYGPEAREQSAKPNASPSGGPAPSVESNAPGRPPSVTVKWPDVLNM